MITLIVTLMAFIFSSLYIYFTQLLNNGIIYWSIPIIFLVFWVLSLIIFVVFLLLTSLFHSKKNNAEKLVRYYYYWVNHTALFLRRLFNVKVKFENIDLLHSQKNYLLVMNHQSMFDTFVIASMLNKRPVTFISKDSLIRVPLIGRFLHAAGFIALDRKSNRKGLEAISLGIRKLKEGKPLAVYPEGTRSRTHEMLEFRNGAFKMALKAEVPIVVLMLDGFYKKGIKNPFVRTKVIARVCKILEYQDIKDLNTNEIGDIVKGIIEENFEDARGKYNWLN